MSYISLADANAYVVAYILDTAPWDDSDDAMKQKVLNIADQKIDVLAYAGCKTVSTQEQQFPRGGDTEVPTKIQQASVDIALAMLDGIESELEFDNEFVVGSIFGSTKTTFDRSATRPHIIAGIPSIIAWHKLLPYLRDPREISLVRV